MVLSRIEKLVRFVMNSGISDAELCKFLVLETFAHIKISAFYAAEVTEDGYLSPVATFGIPAHVVAGWGNIPLSVNAPFTDSIKNDKVILLKKVESLVRYPSLANYEGVPQGWESYLVCPILPYGLIALTLDSTPKIDRQFESFLKTVGVITIQHLSRNQKGFKNSNHSHGEKGIKKSGSLTDRQILIKKLMEKGLVNTAIAKEIGYSESLVRQETMRIYATLNISGRKELLGRFDENGVLGGS